MILSNSYTVLPATLNYNLDSENESEKCCYCLKEDIDIHV